MHVSDNHCTNTQSLIITANVYTHLHTRLLTALHYACSIDCIDGQHDVSARVTRSDLEALCSDLGQGVAAACRAAVLDAGPLHFTAPVTVELLGGGSYIPLFRAAVQSVFGEQHSVGRTINSAEAVATGLALGAARHSSVCRLRPFAVRDRTHRGWGFTWR
jgi:molecular chaperone DnaK (HSP70)